MTLAFRLKRPPRRELNLIEERIPLLEEILGERSDELGGDLTGYKNHVYRMVHFCFAQRNFDDEEREKIVLAGAFHDLGIWTADTFDYLPPSIDLAKVYLSRKGMDQWTPEIELMINQHHKLRKYGRDELTEVFRKADLVDLSLGLIKYGLSADYVRQIKAQFPNADFHKQLVKRAGKWFCRHPLNPVPVLKW